MAETIFLPEEMAPFRTQLEQTQRNIIRITTEETENPLSVYTSKLGGKPYFPLSEKYPYNNQGQPLYMIAQINFSTLSQNSEILAKISEDSYLKHLPIKGILSFFIDYYDDFLGSNFGNPDDPTSYKIFYFPEIETDETKLITDFSFLETENANFMPMLANHEEYAFNFQIERQLVTLESFEWMNIMDRGSYDFIEELPYSKGRSSDDVYEEYSEAYSGGHHNMGGILILLKTIQEIMKLLCKRTIFYCYS